jgi:hypothetical protein
MSKKSNGQVGGDRNVHPRWDDDSVILRRIVPRDGVTST